MNAEQEQLLHALWQEQLEQKETLRKIYNGVSIWGFLILSVTLAAYYF